jgi:transposase
VYASSIRSGARWSPRRTGAGARRCSPRRGGNGYSNFSPSNPTPHWPSWAYAWTAPSRLPRSISGCGSSVGSLKKTLAAAEQARADVAARRAHWQEDLGVEPTAGLVFVDESGAHTRMTRLRGRALGGQRLQAHVPRGRYESSTLIAGIRLDGPCAPWLFEGPMDGEMFLAWRRQGLAPALRPGDVVILDNLATHKIRGVREALEAVGARLMYLPPYSPDFNPIEPMWSKVKQILRSHAPRTDEQLLLAAKTAFNSISTADCKGFFFSAQYAT